MRRILRLAITPWTRMLDNTLTFKHLFIHKGLSLTDRLSLLLPTQRPQLKKVEMVNNTRHSNPSFIGPNSSFSLG
jgi:hypothetical protein